MIFELPLQEEIKIKPYKPKQSKQSASKIKLQKPHQEPPKSFAFDELKMEIQPVEISNSREWKLTSQRNVSTRTESLVQSINEIRNSTPKQSHKIIPLSFLNPGVLKLQHVRSLEHSKLEHIILNRLRKKLNANEISDTDLQLFNDIW
jgi:hypothetical protein